jgi:hypothetical protein
LEQFVQKVKQEWVEEKDKYWEGLQTKEDEKKCSLSVYAEQPQSLDLSAL